MTSLRILIGTLLAIYRNSPFDRIYQAQSDLTVFLVLKTAFSALEILAVAAAISPIRFAVLSLRCHLWTSTLWDRSVILSALKNPVLNLRTKLVKPNCAWYNAVLANQLRHEYTFF